VISKNSKKLSVLFISGIVLGIIAHTLNLFLIRPAIDNNSLSKQLNIVLINLVLVPSIAIFIYTLLKSLETKKYPLATLSMLALFIMTAMVWYFSSPIVHPPVGL